MHDKCELKITEIHEKTDQEKVLLLQDVARTMRKEGVLTSIIQLATKLSAEEIESL